MSWLNLNQSFNSIKGQITNFATEVLTEGNAQDSGDKSTEIDQDLQYFKDKCEAQELEITALKKLNDELQTTLQSERLSRKNGLKEEDTSWYWDPPPQTSNNNSMHDEYKQEIQSLQNQISHLKLKSTADVNIEELRKLREENKNLTASLEDLDSQHQMAMERLLTLKKELQKNFEVLRQEHEELKKANISYSEEIKSLQEKLREKEDELEKTATSKPDYDTLQHKYQNLERVHSMLRENAEKFQEENQDLNEEVFQLQERVTKLEHELELSSKHSELSDAVPRDRYEELLKELNDLRDSRNSLNRLPLEETNIDDNAKGVIENLKREINELKVKLEQKESQKRVQMLDSNQVKEEKIMQLFNKYVNFEIPVDLVGDIPSSGDHSVIHKLESVFKTVNYLKKEIDSLEHKLSEKTLNEKHLQTQIDDLNINESQLQTQIDDLTTENDFLTSDLQQYENEMKEMKKNNDFLLEEITVLKNTSKLEPIIETHEDNIAKLETELADSNQMNKTFEAEMIRIENEFTEVRSEKTSLQNDLTDLKNKYSELLTELETYKSKTKEVEDLQTNENLEQVHKLKNALDEIIDLKSKLNTVSSKNEQLNIDIHIVENDKILLTKKIDDLVRESEEKDSVIQSLTATKSDLEMKIKELEMNLIETQRNNVEIGRTDIALINRIREVLKTDDNSSATREAEDETDRLVRNVENNMNLVTLLRNQLERAQTDNFQLTRALQEASEKANSLNQRAELLQSKLTHLQDTERHLLHNISMMERSRSPEDYMELQRLKNIMTAVKAANEEMERELDDRDNFIPTPPPPPRSSIPQMEMSGAHEFERMKILFERDLEIQKLNDEISQRDSEIQELNSAIMQCNGNLEHLNQVMGQLQETVNAKNTEIEDLKESLSQVMMNSQETYNELQESKNALEKALSNKDIYEQNAAFMRKEISKNEKEITELKNQKEQNELAIIEYKTELEIKKKKIKELHQSVIELEDKLQSESATSQQNDTEMTKTLNEIEILDMEMDHLRMTLTTKELELAKSSETIERLRNTCAEYRTSIANCNVEKNELINLINLKHNENIQYHNEIQRLNHVILEQNNEFKKILEEKDRLPQTQSVLETQCSDCDKFKLSLKEKDEAIMKLNQTLSDYENVKSDLSNANDLIQNLTQKCENLDQNLNVKSNFVKSLTAKNAQLLEEDENLKRELERLREHLLEMEESHTQEMMTSEQRLVECQARLQQVEERAKQTSTVYTSNSIRANQEVETLRNQIRLLEKQREEVQAKLSEEDNSRLRNEAALTNLQIVLEQFQQDKERDIEAATEKIRNKMEDVKRQNRELYGEIGRLNAKLEESLAGLQAASRLGEQLETKTAAINDLKEQVRALQTSLQASEERYYSAISNQQDKVDKNLVKNLVLNYIQKANQSTTNRTQVLRILSTVLDFNQQECERLGLVRGTSSGDSLAQEFVKFLEKESRPAAALPSMMGLTHSSTSSRSGTPPPRKTSLLGINQSPVEMGHRRNPSTGSNNLLFQNVEAVEASSQISVDTGSVHSDRHTNEPRVVSITSQVLENSGVNQMRNTEGAILKHVLKDM